MSLEIEKKYLVGNFDEILNILKKEFGEYNIKNKSGFWFCSNCSKYESILELKETKISKKEVSFIKEIGEISLPIQDYDFVRVRIVNNDKYFITFKNKGLISNIEKNIEYEFEIEKDILERIIIFLKENSSIFYYNIKKSYEFHKDDVSIELSKFNDLKNPYLEIEVTGDNEEFLFSKIRKIIKKFDQYSLKEESRNYVVLSFTENKNILKYMKLSQYSRNAFIELQKKLD